MNISKLAQFGTKHVAKGIGRLTQEVLESGAGSYVTTVEGRRMLDFTSGIGVTNLGRKSQLPFRFLFLLIWSKISIC